MYSMKMAAAKLPPLLIPGDRKTQTFVIKE